MNRSLATLVSPSRSFAAVCITATMVGTGIGCREGQTPADVTTERDSAGIRIVENRAPLWSNGSGWTLSAEPAVSIGSAFGDSAHVWEVRGAVRLLDGRIAVLAAGAREIQIFGRDGQLHRKIGRAGRGPGEFSYPQHLQRIGQDSLIVWDAQYGPITSFDTAGRVTGRRQVDLGKLMKILERGQFTETQTPLPDGSFVAHVATNRRAEHLPIDKLTRFPIQYLRIRSDFSSDTIGWFEGLELMYVRMNERVTAAFPVFPTHASIAAGGQPLRIHATNGSPFEVLTFNESGRLEQVVRRLTPPVPITNREREAAMEWVISRNSKRPGAREVWEKLFAALPEQPYYPAINALVVDELGYLWAENQGDGWSVFDERGRWLGRVKVPLAKVFSIGPDYIIGLSRDDFDVERILEYKLNRSRPTAGMP